MTMTKIGRCTYTTDGVRSSITLPSGKRIFSEPHPTAEYEARARELGYPDGAAMSREHDAIHVALADVFGGLPPVLLEVAYGDERDRGFEEDLVKIIALRLNAPASDDQPGGGFVKWLRGVLRSGHS